MVDTRIEGSVGEPDGGELVRIVEELLLTESVDSTKGVDPDDLALQELTVKMWTEDKQAKELLNRVKQGARVEFRKVFEGKIYSRILTRTGQKTKSHKRQVSLDAKRLMKRHNDRVITGEFLRIAEGMRNQIEKKQEWKNMLNVKKKDWRANGFFLLEYGMDLPSEQKSRDINDRLLRHYEYADSGGYSPRFIIVETGGRHPDSNVEPKYLHDRGTWCADCHIHLPAPVRSAVFVMEMPNKNDDPPSNREWVNTVRPHEVALVEDIVCFKDMAGLALAPAALSDALDAIANQANPTRRNYPIRYIAADIASVDGYITPDGEEVYFQRDLHVPPIFNDRSDVVFNQFQDERLVTSFQTYCTLNKRIHDVERGYKIIVTWFRKVAELKGT